MVILKLNVSFSPKLVVTEFQIFFSSSKTSVPIQNETKFQALEIPHEMILLAFAQLK